MLSKALAGGRRIYSAAYIMPPGGSAFGHTAKHQNHLRLLERMMTDEVPARLGDMKRMQDAFELLLSYPTIGDFLAYQFVTDINYSEVTNFSEMEFVMPGPGALDGIRKCFSSLGGLNEPEIIRLMADIQEDEFAAARAQVPVAVRAAIAADRLPESVLRGRQVRARRASRVHGRTGTIAHQAEVLPDHGAHRVLVSAEMGHQRGNRAVSRKHIPKTAA